MKHFRGVIGVTLALSSAMTFAQATAQGDSSTQSQTSVSAGQGGASTSHNSSGAARVDAGKSDAELAGGSQINATLSKPVDASKSKPGDEVTATTAEDVKSDGHVVIPKGSKLVGHVTSAKRRGDKPATSAPAANGADSTSMAASATGEAASHLGIVFEKAILKDGREVPLGAGIQALASGEGAASGQMDDVGGAMSGAGSMAGSARGTGGGLVGGATGAVGGAVRGTTNAAGAIGGTVGSTVGGTAGVMSRSPGAVGGLNGAGRLTSDSRGVFGMKGLELTSANTGSAQGSLITSSTRNVRLDRGTRMLLVTSGDAAGSTTAAGGARGLSGSADAAGNLSGAASTAGRAANTGEASGVTGAASGATRAGTGLGRAGQAPGEGAASTSVPAGDQTSPR
jgi:hypothetical protein